MRRRSAWGCRVSDSRRAVAEVVLRKLLAAHPHLADEARQYARAHIEGEAMREAEALIAPPKSPRRYTPPPEPVDEVSRARARQLLGLPAAK